MKQIFLTIVLVLLMYVFSFGQSSGPGIVDGEDIIVGTVTADEYLQDDKLTNPTVGEGKYKFYSKDGIPHFLSDSYFFALSQEIYLHSQLISELSLFPFKPLRSVGGFDLGYNLYFDSASCTNAIKEVESVNVMRIQDDGTITNGNLVMLGSSVAADIDWMGEVVVGAISGTGTGVLTASMNTASSSATAVEGVYVLTMLETEGDEGYTGAYSVVDPDGTSLVNGVLGIEYIGGGLRMTWADGGVMTVDDTVSATVTLSYMSNANTTFNWNGTGEDTAQLMTAGYLRQALVRSGTNLNSALELALTSATYIDVIVKMNTTYTTPENNIGVFFQDNARARYTTTGTLLRHEDSTVYVDFVAWYGSVDGTARTDAPMNKRLQVFNDTVNDEGNYILSNLVGGVPTVEHQYVNQVGTQVSADPYYCGPVLTLNPTNYPNPEISITVGAVTDGTTNGDVYGMYIYWEN